MVWVKKAFDPPSPTCGIIHHSVASNSEARNIVLKVILTRKIPTTRHKDSNPGQVLPSRLDPSPLTPPSRPKAPYKVSPGQPMSEYLRPVSEFGHVPDAVPQLRRPISHQTGVIVNNVYTKNK
jgi:hypothetical protein